MRNLRQFATYRRICGVLYRIGSETEDRQGGARPPRASNFKFIYREKSVSFCPRKPHRFSGRSR